METTLKQRLIGAAVIIALAVIFVPMILDGSGREEQVALNMEVPPEPTFTFDSELPDPKKLDELPPIETDTAEESAEAEPEKAEPESAEMVIEQESTQTAKSNDPEKPVQENVAAVTQVVEATEDHIETNPALSAWAVQVAAFGEKGKAIALQEKLLAKNLPVFTEQSGKGKKLVYRVKVGPELKKEDADNLRDKIEKEYGLKGSFVTKHP